MLVIRDATLPSNRTRDVRVNPETGTIDAVDTELAGETYLDAKGKRLFPGMIDAHVHFREPGFTQKEDWTTGSQSAVAGGVTTVIDQPNTDPPTISGSTYSKKTTYADKSYVDFGLNGGVTPDWDPDSLLSKPICALGEIFLADSTGEMGITEDLFTDAITRAAHASIPVTVHAEDATRFDTTVQSRSDADAWSAYRTPESEVTAIENACDIATQENITIHIAHTSTPRGIDIAHNTGMTCEVTPHHVFLSRDDLETLDTHGKMNPPLRSESRRAAVYERVVDGTVDIIATDHAPHTHEEKNTTIWDAPSGVPGVETALPLLLADAANNGLSYERIRDLTATNPANIFNFPTKGKIEPGYDADLYLVDTTTTTTITADTLHSKCTWTPFEGKQGIFPEWTMIRGTIVYDSHEFTPHTGRNVRG